MSMARCGVWSRCWLCAHGAIHSSITYRIDRVITWLPRMLREILRKTHCTPVDIR